MLIGGRGSDPLSRGAGDDTFVWNPGDGSDTVEGQGGLDTMQFNGANIDEKIDLVGQRQSPALYTRRRQYHHGYRRRGDRQRRSPWRRRQDQRRQSDRHRRDGRKRRSSRPRPEAVQAMAVRTLLRSMARGIDNVQITGTTGGSFTVAGLTTLVVQITGVEAANDQLVVAR